MVLHGDVGPEEEEALSLRGEVLGVEAAQSFRDSCARGSKRHRGPGLLSPCSQIRNQDPDPDPRPQALWARLGGGCPCGAPMAAVCLWKGDSVGLAPSSFRSAGRQWEAWEGLEEHGESQVSGGVPVS